MRRLLLLSAAAAGLSAGAAHAQFPTTRRPPGQAVPAPLNRTDPVAFTADEVTYDRDNALVTASGNVEAWQNDHVLRADRIVFDRNTNVAAASGHVVMVEPDGQVLFSDYAEMTEGMRDGVLRGMRALLAENGRLVANGARRTQGTINELSRAVYTTCNLCAADPTKPPLWQLRARSAVQDGEHHRIEYQDVALDIYGQPVAWFPYFWHADPSVKRASGFLVPSFGQSKHLGQFLATPYYWAIDDVSDATITPTFNTSNYLNVSTEYRRRFNDGTLTVEAGVGQDRSHIGGDIFAKGRFSLDETWRYGFDLARASSADYLRDYRVANRGDVLTSKVFMEGFGVGSYAKIDAIAFQGLVESIKQTRLPYVLPRYQYNFFGEPDALGGRLSFDTVNFNVVRQIGTNTQRAAASLTWQRPFTGALGEVYGLTLQTDTAGYSATSLDQAPNFYTRGSSELVHAHPQAALEVRWPLVRDGGSSGTQLIEPRAQVVAGPNTGPWRNSRIPNEDSLDLEFTDQNLFSLNRYPGFDRHEGGVRFNVGLRMNWQVGGTTLDNFVGQSFRLHRDDSFPPGSGLERRASDIVTRTILSPANAFDIIARTRLDRSNLSVKFADLTSSTGVPKFRVNAGYLYSNTNPYLLYDQATTPISYLTPRNEITLGFSSQVSNYKLSGYARRDLQTSKMTSAGLHATYEDECFIFDVNVSRRYTSLNNDNGASLVLFQLTFKTVGQFGFHAF